jgi:hypothetical protein
VPRGIAHGKVRVHAQDDAAVSAVVLEERGRPLRLGELGSLSDPLELLAGVRSMKLLWHLVVAISVAWSLVTLVVLAWGSILSRAFPGGSGESDVTFHSPLVGESRDDGVRLALQVTKSGGGAAGWVYTQLVVLPCGLTTGGPDGTVAIQGQVAAERSGYQPMQCRWRDGVLEIGESTIEIRGSQDYVRSRLDSVDVDVRVVKAW